MKKIFLYSLALSAIVSCASGAGKETSRSEIWKSYDVGEIVFEDKAPQTAGSVIYHSIIPDPESYIQEQARTVLATLYDSPEDSIVKVDRIYYTLEDAPGISAKGGGNGNVSIFYSTRHIEKSFEANDTARVLFETRGVLLHELTHAYQLEPQGIGTYGTTGCTGRSLKVWLMQSVWQTAVLKALRPGLKGATIWMDTVPLDIFLYGSETTRILNSLLNSTGAPSRWFRGLSMEPSSIFWDRNTT